MVSDHHKIGGVTKNRTAHNAHCLRHETPHRVMK